MKKAFIFLTTLSCFFTACKKDNQTETIAAIGTSPSIQAVSVSSTTIHQYTDSIKFFINYQDGDGDLGDYSADSLSLYITDSRNSTLVNKFHIPPVAPLGSSIVVQGQFVATLKTIILLNSSSSSENAVFSIKMKDRAGHWSNIVNSPTITILP